MSEKIFFPYVPLYIVAILGLVGAAAIMLPIFFEGEVEENLSVYGNLMYAVAEIILVSLIAFKVYKENLKKPSYVLLASYAVLLGVAAIISLLSDEISLIFDIINIILSIFVGFSFVSGENTKKIGLWLLLSIVGGILFLVAVGYGYADTPNKVIIGIFLIPIWLYLSNCVKYLTTKDEI